MVAFISPRGKKATNQYYSSNGIVMEKLILSANKMLTFYSDLFKYRKQTVSKQTEEIDIGRK